VGSTTDHICIDDNESTLETLTDAEDLLTERCSSLPASVGELLTDHVREGADAPRVAQFAWLPEEFEATNLVSEVPVATFTLIDAGSDTTSEASGLLVIERPNETAYYLLDRDDLNVEVKRFATGGDADGGWVSTENLSAASAP
jgi:hypothetical protein